MRITRIFSDDSGESHFGELDIELRDAGEIGRLSALYGAKGIIFRENDAGYDYDWHNAPRGQYVILLDGEIEIEVSDGEIKKLRGGDILLVEDTSGKGHRTRAIGNKPRKSVFVTLE